MLPAVMAGISIASSVAGMAGGLGAQKDAQKAAENQAKLTMFTRNEEIRRQQVKNRQQIGSNKAKVAASNIQMSGSAKRALDETKAEMARDISWRRFSSAKEQESIKAGAPGSSAALATIAGGIGQIANTGMNYYK